MSPRKPVFNFVSFARFQLHWFTIAVPQLERACVLWKWPLGFRENLPQRNPYRLDQQERRHEHNVEHISASCGGQVHLR